MMSSKEKDEIKEEEQYSVKANGLWNFKPDVEQDDEGDDESASENLFDNVTGDELKIYGDELDEEDRRKLKTGEIHWKKEEIIEYDDEGNIIGNTIIDQNGRISHEAALGRKK